MDDSPVSATHDKRRGSNLNEKKLQRDVQYGFLDIVKFVEIIRLADLIPDNSGRLLNDLIKFRDVFAHKGFHNIIFLQMATAFVLYFRNLLGILPISHEPTSTATLQKTFARMADINVMISLEWFFNLWENKTITTVQFERWMTNGVKPSSFASWEFSIDPSDFMVLTTGKIRQQLDNHNIQEHVRTIYDHSVDYTTEEERQLTDLWFHVKNVYGI